MKQLKYIILWFVGGAIYILMELLWRGFSHWTMLVLGGICFICYGLENEILPWGTPFIIQMLIGGIITTLLEFITGYIINIKLGWNVWDYSNVPFNFMGQICLSHSVLWCFVSAIGIVLDDYLRYWWFGEEKPRYKLF